MKKRSLFPNKPASAFLAAVLLSAMSGCSGPKTPASSQTSVQSTVASISSQNISASAAPAEDNLSAVPSDEILVACFSQAQNVPEDADAAIYATPSTGNTLSVAQEIAEMTGGTLFEIQTEETYPSDHGEASQLAEQESENDARPVLSSHVDDMAKYQVIILGFPIWWHHEPMAIRSFLDEYNLAGKTILPFCTSMEVPIDQSVEEIRQLCPSSTVLDGLRLPTAQESDVSQLADWLKQYGLLHHETDSQQPGQ